MKKFIFLFLLVALIPATGCYAKGPWKGKVIDAETKQPIEGAVVVAVWEKELRGPAGGETRFLDAVETVTNKDGEFNIPSIKFLSIPLIRIVKGPFFTFYKPGYGSTPKWVVKMPYNKHTQSDYFETQGAMVELPRLKTKDERMKNLPHLIIGTEGHENKTKKYIQLLNQERVELGLDPYKEGK
jgi:hypothetical protein